jgi:hypothetical protein
MGQDNQPKHRQIARNLRRRSPSVNSRDRILIVSEGTKTEPNYINEIRVNFRLSTANVQVIPSALGTEPIQVVQYAEDLFRNGDACRSVEPRSFDRVIAVFDRDDHQTYHAALSKAEALDARLVNDIGKRIPFIAIASVPCFELWLLLHYENIQAPIHRDVVYSRLQAYLPNYDKGQYGVWAATNSNLSAAIENALLRVAATDKYNGLEPYTDIHVLISYLKELTS